MLLILCRIAACVAVITSLLAFGEVQARDFFVSTAGDDMNTGVSVSMPWRSIARVNKQSFAPGDRVLFRGGDHFDGNLIFDSTDQSFPAKPMTVSSYGRGRATVRAGNGTGILIENLGNFVVRDLIIAGADRKTNKGSGVKFVNSLPNNAKLSNIRIENVDASRFGQEGIFVGGAPIDKSQSGYVNVRIISCIAHDNAYYGVWVTGVWDQNSKTYANKDVVIAHCTAYDNPGDPDFLENHSGNGIMLDDVEVGKIEYCVAYNNGRLCNAKKGGPVGIWAHASNNVTIQFCASFNNRTGKSVDGGGFDFDGGVTNSVMQYNYSSGNDGAGYLLYTYDGAPHTFRGNIVRYNISENDGRKNKYAGIYVGNDGSGVSDLEIYHNTIYVSPSAGGSPQAVYVVRTTNVHFRNNLFVATGGLPLLDVGPHQHGLIFQGNNYWSSGAPFLIRDSEKNYTDLNAWRDASKQEIYKEAKTGMSIDPGLNDPGAGETLMDIRQLSKLSAYKLRPNSPMIDAGLDLLLHFGTIMGGRDFWGQKIPQGRVYDIGAHELR